MQPISLFLCQGAKLLNKACLFALICILLAGCGLSYQNPPKSLEKTDLIGTWEVSYDEWGKDSIALGIDSFTQKYQDSLGQGHTYEFTGHQWQLERLPQGLVRIHLQGAKYFRLGVDFSNQSYLYDSFANETLTIQGELVLEVRVTQANEFVLYHLTTDADAGGVSLFGNSANFFRKVSSK